MDPKYLNNEDYEQMLEEAASETGSAYTDGGESSATGVTYTDEMVEILDSASWLGAAASSGLIGAGYHKTGLAGLAASSTVKTGTTLARYSNISLE